MGLSWPRLRFGALPLLVDKTLDTRLKQPGARMVVLDQETVSGLEQLMSASSLTAPEVIHLLVRAEISARKTLPVAPTNKEQ